MEELSTIVNDSCSTDDDIHTARVRLTLMHNHISDGLNYHERDVAEYEAGLRSAMVTHLNICDSARRDPVTLAGPRSPEAVHSLQVYAQSVRARKDELRHLEPSVQDSVADVYEAHARLGEALRECDEPPLLVLQGLQSRAASTTSPYTSEIDTDLSAAGRLHWELSMSIGTYDDDDPDCEAAREALEHLRDRIPRFTEDEVRAYLTGLLEEVENFSWHGL